MKKITAFLLTLFCIFSLFGCAFGTSGGSLDPEGKKYIVLEATDSYLIVADIAEDGSAVESMKYSVSNPFYPKTQIEAGDIITIKHGDEILETYPMQFGKIYQMEYYNEKTGERVSVIID